VVITLEAAQRIGGHADSRTTKLYDRRGQKVLLEDGVSRGYAKNPQLLEVPVKKADIVARSIILVD
jgi:hypothetical protein